MDQKKKAKSKSADLKSVNGDLSNDELLELESKYCSWGDTVHYMPEPNIFKSCLGSFLYDSEGVEFLDLQML